MISLVLVLRRSCHFSTPSSPITRKNVLVCSPFSLIGLLCTGRIFFFAKPRICTLRFGHRKKERIKKKKKKIAKCSSCQTGHMIWPFSSCRVFSCEHAFKGLSSFTRHVFAGRKRCFAVLGDADVHAQLPRKWQGLAAIWQLRLKIIVS